MEESLTLKDLNEFAKENGLSEDTPLFVFGSKKLLSILSVTTEQPSADALYTDMYLEVEGLRND